MLENMRIQGRDLIDRGWPQGKVIGLALEVPFDYKKLSRKVVLDYLDEVRNDPKRFIGDERVGEIAREWMRIQSPPERPPELYETPTPYAIYGEDLIDEATRAQMDVAMSLPITLSGALLPDAHLGYGLPVGGVLATQAAVIPWAVGVDIGCRLHLSVLPISSYVLGQQPNRFKEALIKSTQFGAGGSFKPGRRPHHEVLEDPRWKLTPLLRKLRQIAEGQLGTSGSGNHFVEWGELETLVDTYPLERGKKYLAILSHSGSRGVGYKVASYYSKVAKEKVGKLLPQRARDLGWLELTDEAGAEYWLSMELSGDFAKANHETIHRKILQAISQDTKDVITIDHHHNYAWIEEHQGQEAIVHRKGATPAAAGEPGVIPGSMGDPGYVVIGKGAEDSLRSASHGAGRRMSRTQAFSTLSEEKFRTTLENKQIELIGGSLDESPDAYKPIEAVMAMQEGLVERVGRFTPKVVRMDSPQNRRRR